MTRAAQTVRLASAVFVLCVATVACGGVQPSPQPIPPSPTPTVAPTAPPIPASTPYAAATTTALATPTPAPTGQTPAPISVPLPSPTASAGVSGSVALPAGSGSSIPAGTTLAQTLTNQAPSGISTLVTLLRSRLAAPNISIIAYVGEEFSAPVTLSAPPSFSFTLSPSNIVSGASYYVALYDPMNAALGWQLGFEGPGALSGDSLSFTGTGGAMTFAANQQYWFGLYAASTAAATPTPAPSATPVPSFSISSSNVSFTAVGQSSTVTASGVAPFAVSGNDKSIATASVSGSTITIGAVSAGTTSVVVSDAYGRSATISVTVTTTSVPIQ